MTMEGYVVVMLGEYKLEGCAGTSATEILSEIATDNALWTEKPAEQYRSRVEKLLYLVKLVILYKFTAIIFLGTRAQSTIVQDWERP